VTGADLKDHMLNEHDVKYDSDVVLAASVMSQKEKAFIVKSSLQRLSEISNNQIPSSEESLLTQSPETTLSQKPRQIQPSPNGTPRQINPIGYQQRVRPSQSSSSQMVRRAPLPRHPMQIRRPNGISIPRNLEVQRLSVTTARPQAPSSEQQLPPNFPAHLGISVSRVDQSVNCDICQIVFPNKAALMDHMQDQHLSRLTGLSMVTPGSKRHGPPEVENSRRIFPTPVAYQQGSMKRQRTNETSINNGLESLGRKISVSNHNASSGGDRSTITLKNDLTPMNRKLSLPSQNSTMLGNLSLPTPPSVKGLEPRYGTKHFPSPGKEETLKPDPVIKCNNCSQFIKQSLFENHKRTHSQPACKTNESKKVEEKLVEYIDIGVADGESDKKEITPRFAENKIQCPSCDKKLVSNMALKMHINLKHPVKTEGVDTEQLLSDEIGEFNRSESEDKIRNEVESMETLQLLDNLVNFLNDN